MTHIGRNSLGMEVRDLIAELQRHPANERTDIAEVVRYGGHMIPVILKTAVESERNELGLEVSTLRASAVSARLDLESYKREHAALIKTAAAARVIMLRIKRLKRQRPLPLP